MGNAASCAPSILSNGVVKVLQLSKGRIQIYAKPVKAADLMLENAGYFVCHAGRLKVGHRILGLTAEEELQRRQLYFLLPMELLYSVLTHEEMSSLSYKASKALKHASFQTKIFPMFSEFCIFPSEIEEENSVSGQVDSSAERTYSKQRSWKPALETIVETPPGQS